MKSNFPFVFSNGIGFPGTKVAALAEGNATKNENVSGNHFNGVRILFRIR